MGSLNKIIFLVLPLIINQFMLHLLPVVAKDVLRAGDALNSLDPTSTLVSANGEFTLGFFTIEATNLTYIGIWYTNDKHVRKVWVANSNKPLIGDGALIIDESGTLKVITNNTTMFNVSNEVGSGNTRAVLENSGNFVLYDNAATDNIRTLWQSFDHPTNTLLPGMKLGYNLTTRQNWTLTSWISDVIPASGTFKMSLEKIQNSPQLRIYRKNGEVYWSSGPWKNGTFDKKMFSFPMDLPEKQSLIFDSSGMYFTFQTVPYTVSMLRLSSGGRLDDGETDIPPSIKNLVLVIIVVTTVAIILSPILAACLCYGNIRMCCMRIRRRRREAERRRRDAYIHQLTNTHSFNFGDELEKGIDDAPDVKIFSLKAILTATDNFSNKNKLGQGGYGPVYKGNLFDGRQIAVKRLSKLSGQGLEEFKSELILISKLQHKNLVRLYGCCIHQEEKMLIYEFMPNKSLDFFLFVEYENEKIDWGTRFNIIEGIAQGLLYLHKYSRMTVIHRDLKVSNILLDENMNPKIADFGTARIFQQNVTEAITHRVVGTYGYMAPEYAMEGTFSIKSDVFSFGVLILEIISGKRNSSFYNLDRPVNLVGYAWELWKEEAALELKDESLGESCDVKQLLKTIHVSLLCVQEYADDRPTMSEVISMFNNEIADLPIPKQPAFFTGRHPVETERKSIPGSVNGLTITMMEPR